MPVHLFTPSSFHIARSYPPPTPVNLPTSPRLDSRGPHTQALLFLYLLPYTSCPPYPYYLVGELNSPNAFIYYSNGIYSISTSFYCAPSSCISFWDSQTPVSEHYIVADNNGPTILRQLLFLISSVSHPTFLLLTSQAYRHMNRSPTLLSVAPTMPQPLHSLDTSTQRDIVHSHVPFQLTARIMYRK